jgi:hypothetical protein
LVIGNDRQRGEKQLFESPDRKPCLSLTPLYSRLQLKSKGHEAYKAGNFNDACVYYTEYLSHETDAYLIYASRSAALLVSTTKEESCDTKTYFVSYRKTLRFLLEEIREP